MRTTHEARSPVRAPRFVLFCLWEGLGRLLQHKLRLYAVGELDLRELQRGLLLGLGKLRGALLGRTDCRLTHLGAVLGHLRVGHLLDRDLRDGQLVELLLDARHRD